MEAAEIKHRGDELLKKVDDASFRGRKLGIVDSTIIACALRLGVPVLSGDKDLTYVATHFGVEVIW